MEARGAKRIQVCQWSGGKQELAFREQMSHTTMLAAVETFAELCLWKLFQDSFTHTSF